jgi:MYXO-CTERM domain-containing protein
MEQDMKNINTILAVGAMAAVCGGVEAAVVAGWTIPTAIPASPATSGSNFTYGAADAGGAAAGTSLSGYHALAATAWSTPAGNGSASSLSSNNWSVGDYYQVSLSTASYVNISLSWDQTRSGTGPSNFRVDMSTDGTTFSTILASYSVIQAGASGTSSWSSSGPVQSAFTTTIASVAGADGRSTLRFRFVNLSTVGTSSGTNRIDNITVSGTLVPAPGAIALLGVAGLVGVRRRR